VSAFPSLITRFCTNITIYQAWHFLGGTGTWTQGHTLSITFNDFLKYACSYGLLLSLNVKFLPGTRAWCTRC
jgi:hypothetical protein